MIIMRQKVLLAAHAAAAKEEEEEPMVVVPSAAPETPEARERRLAMAAAAEERAQKWEAAQDKVQVAAKVSEVRDAINDKAALINATELDMLLSAAGLA